MLDRLRIVVGPRVLHRYGNGGARGLLAPNHRTDRHLQTEEVTHQLGNLALRQTVNTHENRDDGIHSRPERARGDAFRQLARRPMTAQTAINGVLLILGDHGLDRGQLEHLMSMRLRVTAVQESIACVTLLWNAGNDLVDLLWRHQDPLMPFVPWLSTWLAPRPCLLRSRFHTRTIAGGWLRGVSRRLRERLFQHSKLSPQLRNSHIPLCKLPSQVGNQLVAGVRHSSTESCGDHPVEDIRI